MNEITIATGHVESDVTVDVEADELEFDRETLSDYLAMAHRC